MSCTSLAHTGLPVAALIGLAGVLVATGAVLIVVSRRRRSSTTTTVVVLLVMGVGVLAGGAVGYTPAHAGTPRCGPTSSTPGAGAPALTSTTRSGASGSSGAEPTSSDRSVASSPSGSPSLTTSSATGSPPSSTVSTSAPTTSSTPPEEGSLTIVQTSTMAGLAPGIAPMDITGTVTNRGTESTFVTTVTVGIFAVTKAAGAADGPCDATDFVLLDVDMPVGQTLTPGQGFDFSGAKIGFSNKRTVNQDACRHSVVTLHYVSS